MEQLPVFQNKISSVKQISTLQALKWNLLEGKESEPRLNRSLSRLWHLVEYNNRLTSRKNGISIIKTDYGKSLFIGPEDINLNKFEQNIIQADNTLQFWKIANQEVEGQCHWLVDAVRQSSNMQTIGITGYSKLPYNSVYYSSLFSLYDRELRGWHRCGGNHEVAVTQINPNGDSLIVDYTIGHTTFKLPDQNPAFNLLILADNKYEILQRGGRSLTEGLYGMTFIERKDDADIVRFALDAEAVESWEL